MRLFGKVDGQINNLDRAQYLTMPFDLAFQGAFRISVKRVAALSYTRGSASSLSYTKGSANEVSYTKGSVTEEGR